METKEIKKKLTIGDLIANADKIKGLKNETKELYIKSLDATITIMKPSRSTILDSDDLSREDKNFFLVYECIVDPNLKDALLQAAYGVTGYEILDKIMDPGEMDNIAKEMIRFSGYDAGRVSVVEDIKN